jgi:uncharacterized Fe-S cluster protein YjdI
MLSNENNPKTNLWLAIENAKTEELKAQMSKCPSEAISYLENT